MKSVMAGIFSTFECFHTDNDYLQYYYPEQEASLRTKLSFLTEAPPDQATVAGK